MKKFILIFLMGSAFFSCKPETSNSFLIEATIDTLANGKLAKLVYVQDRKPITKDSMTIANGKFSFTGVIDTPDLYYITVDGDRNNLPLILENEKYTVNLNLDSLYTSKVHGGAENKVFASYQQYMLDISKYNQKYSRIFREAQIKKDTATMESMRKKYDSLLEVNKAFDFGFIEKNNNSVAAAMVLEKLYNNKVIDDEKAIELYDNLSDKAKNNRAGEVMGKTLMYAVGKIAPNFSAPDKDGNLISLNDIKGKVTIVDFWAAWCGPCRRENPNVVKVYNKYHEKGLEIIGVSLDGNPRQKDAKEAWLKAIDDDSLTWHQVSNLKYFDGPVAKQYNINSIPATFILDEKGKIIAKNLRGAALEEKISELLD